MKNNRNLIIGVVLLFVGLNGLWSRAGMMDGWMMERGGMRNMMGAQLPPGIDPGDLPEPQSNGAEHLGKYCTQCHEMPGPGMHTAEEWPRVVERMNWRMQMMSGRKMMGMMHDIKAPTDRELETLNSYLQKNAQKPIDKSKYEDLNSTAGQSFEAVCSRCHALPDPKQHTGEEWSAVVQRMVKNMKSMGKSVPDEETIETILGFLQKHAR